MEQLHTIYKETIVQSRYVKSHDPDYHKRQVDQQKKKITKPEKYHKCKCGELIRYDITSETPFEKSKYGKNHIKTNKHVSSMMRIYYDKNEFNKSKYFNNLTKLLYLNNHLNWKLNNHISEDCIYDKLRRVKCFHNYRARKSDGKMCKRYIGKWTVQYIIEQAIRRYKINKL
jgi:hypothetical protein